MVPSAMGKQPEYELPEGTPEFYIDSAHVNTQLYSSMMLLGKLRPDDRPLIQVIIKMSPPMLKALSLILSKHVRDYEGDLGAIPLPKKLLHDLGLEELI